MIIFFTIGGGTFIGVFIMLLISLSSQYYTNKIIEYMQNNATVITVISLLIIVSLSLIISAIIKNFKCIIPFSLMLIHNSFSLIYGFYSSFNDYKGFFVSLITLMAYIGVNIISIGTSCFACSILFDDDIEENYNILTPTLITIVCLIISAVFWI